MGLAEQIKDYENWRLERQFIQYTADEYVAWLQEQTKIDKYDTIVKASNNYYNSEELGAFVKGIISEI